VSHKLPPAEPGDEFDDYDDDEYDEYDDEPPRHGKVYKAIKWLLILVIFGIVAGITTLVVVYKMIDIPDPNKDFQAQTTFVYYSDGKHLLGTFATQDRINVSLSDVPQHVQDAVIAAEDRTFYTNSGIDPKGIIRAAWNNLRSNSTQGGSTITQQYVKILYLSQERTWQRKIKEAFLAVKIQREQSKQEILQGYLNTIYFGRGAYGIEAAARAYYDKSASELTVPEGAVLASILNSPSDLDPAVKKSNRQELLARYQYVLSGMVDMGNLDADKAAKFERHLPPFAHMEVKNSLGGPKGFLLALTESELRKDGFSDEEIYGGGLKVITTFDWEAQNATRKAVQAEQPTIAAKGVHIAIASVEPGTGALRAMYGGPDYVKDQRNWALTGRQPGSSFKPFALAAGIEGGYSLFDTFEGNSYTYPNGTNIGNEFGETYGPISLLQATEVSSNTAYADLTNRPQVGPQRVLESAIRAGIPSDAPGLGPNFGIALGTADVTPVDMANGYATFAAQGEESSWYSIEKVTDSSGHVRYQHKVKTKRAFSAGVSADVTYALTQVVDSSSGTGTAAQALGCAAAAKTGTAALRPDTVTSAWFVGYTPKLSTAVMYVKGKNATADLDGVGGLPTFFGGDYPARTWTAFMQDAGQGVNCQDFPPPAYVSGTEPPPTTVPPTIVHTPTPSDTPTQTPSSTPTHTTTSPTGSPTGPPTTPTGSPTGPPTTPTGTSTNPTTTIHPGRPSGPGGLLDGLATRAVHVPPARE
jgi:membrane peptidoglycan carboxypeptidase